MATPSTALFVDPFSHHYEHDRLFGAEVGAHAGDGLHGTWVLLRQRLAERGIPVHTADLLASGAARPAEHNVYLSLGLRSRCEELASRDDIDPRAFFAFECPIVEPDLYRNLHRVGQIFRRTFAFSDQESLRPFLGGPVVLEQFRIPFPSSGVHELEWSRRNRDLLVMINANKLPRLTVDELYTERLRAVAFFERFGEIALYGVGWDGPPYRVGATRLPGIAQRLGFEARRLWERVVPSSDPTRAAARRAYRGPARSKRGTLSGFTFAICFENMALRGWVTEKLFDCFACGTVPIYLGAPDIDALVPPDCYIDMRRFADYGDLRAFLRELSPREIDSYRDAGRSFLASEAFRPFSSERFVERVVSMVEDGRTVVGPE